MPYSTVQKIRVHAGVQNMAKEQPMLAVSGSSNVWEVDTGDFYKVVPNQNNGATAPTTSDISVTINGSSVGVSAIDQESGEITLAQGSSTGACVLADYASSPISDSQVYDKMFEAESIVNGYISERYEVPLSVTVPMLDNIETRLAASSILEPSYGTSAQDLAEDGYRMREEALKMLTDIRDGVLNLIDDTGSQVAAREDAGTETDVSVSEGRTPGYLFVPEQEDFELVDLDDIRPTG